MKKEIIIAAIAFSLGLLVMFVFKEIQIQKEKADLTAVLNSFSKIAQDQENLIGQDTDLLHEFSLCIDPGQCSIEKIGAMGKKRYESWQALITEEKALSIK